jgi:hypothetical protein
MFTALFTPPQYIRLFLLFLLKPQHWLYIKKQKLVQSFIKSRSILQCAKKVYFLVNLNRKSDILTHS